MVQRFTKSGLKRLYRPQNKIKPEQEEKVESTVVEQTPIPVNPMAEFFSDLSFVGVQIRDPNLVKPSWDATGTFMQTYLGWLRLAESMRHTKQNQEIIQLLKNLNIKEYIK